MKRQENSPPLQGRSFKISLKKIGRTPREATAEADGGEERPYWDNEVVEESESRHEPATTAHSDRASARAAVQGGPQGWSFNNTVVSEENAAPKPPK